MPLSSSSSSSSSSSPLSALNKPEYMEVLGSRRRSARESSPDRAKVVYNNNITQPNNKPITRNNVKPVIINKKVQVVYYLTRNGHLEHPHYMEVTHFSNQPLRLRDVIDRLTLLRGKGMPSLYSWSCKRSYKNGYVWNDLAENDIIHPADNGGEYVLKGSELLLDLDQGCSEKFQQLQVSNSNRSVQLIHQEPNYNLHSKSSKPLMNPSQHRDNSPEEYQEHEEEEEEDDHDDDDGEESYEDEDHKSTCYTSSTTPHSRCSRGVSTDELDDQEPETHHQLSTTKSHKNPKTIESISTTHHHPDNSTDHSPPPTSSILSREKPDNPNSSNNTSRRFEDGDPDSVSRNSVLLQLISCGSLAVSKAKTAPGSFKQSGGGGLRKGVVCRSAASKVAEEEEIKFMSENPRFGNLQSEEKEYFSGSIVESMSKDRVESAQPILKKSNSYNEERSSKARMEETKVEEERRSNDGVKGKCIPRKKSILSSKKKIKKDH